MRKSMDSSVKEVGRDMATWIPKEPLKIVVPLLAVDESMRIQAFLGTAAFVGQQPLLVTAEHVVSKWNGPFAIVVLPDLGRLRTANLVTKDREVDLAVLQVPGYAPERAFDLAEDDEVKVNQFVTCLEYSMTRVVAEAIKLSPANRLGNVTRFLDLSETLGRAGKNALELSFPALRGASGAPVVSNKTFRLWGVVVSNVAYHLLPAQIETVLDENGRVTEETRFLLPQAVAVHVKHLRPMIDSLA
jgi:S1-C subfamily serine protease